MSKSIPYEKWQSALKKQTTPQIPNDCVSADELVEKLGYSKDSSYGYNKLRNLAKSGWLEMVRIKGVKNIFYRLIDRLND